MNRRTCLSYACALTLIVGMLPALARQGAQPRLPANATILTGANARAVFVQCSRSTPGQINGYWTPAKGDVVALEAALPGFLAAQKLPAAARGRNLQKDLHQCAGFVRGGRKWIYVNGFARRVANDMQGAKLYAGPSKGKRFDWRRDNVDVCDGGASFWGIEYDVEKHTFSSLQFNGPY